MANHETTILSEFDAVKVGHLIGPDGPGFAIVENVVPNQLLRTIHRDLSEPDMPWLPGMSTNNNEHGDRIEQVFDVFAHKLSHGKQERMDHMLGLKALSHMAMKEIVDPLCKRFPSLTSWVPDESVTQRYPERGGVLGWHRDNARHPGVIITYSVEGERILWVRHNGTESGHELYPGFVTIMRATNLYNSHILRRVIGNQHSITIPKNSHGSTSVTIRANSKPDEAIPHMTYYNWDPEADS